MSEMIERVGEALRAECRKQYGSDWNYDSAWAFARAAIEAMREPTAEMVDTGQVQVNLHDPNTPPAHAFELLSEEEVTDIWGAMIDAALADDSAKSSEGEPGV